MTLPPLSRALLTLAAFVVLVAALQAAGSLVLPFLFSAMLTVQVLPAVTFMERYRVPWAAGAPTRTPR